MIGLVLLSEYETHVAADWEKSRSDLVTTVTTGGSP